MVTNNATTIILRKIIKFLLKRKKATRLDISKACLISYSKTNNALEFLKDINIIEKNKQDKSSHIFIYNLNPKYYKDFINNFENKKDEM